MSAPRAQRVVHPRDLQNHLERAAERGVSATLETDEGSSVARVRAFQADALLLEAEPGEQPPAVGRVGVHYGWESLHYTFTSHVLAVDGGRIRLALPEAVDLRDRRAWPRFPVPASLPLVFHAQEPTRLELRVHDVSAGGVALAAEPGLRLNGARHVLMGTLVRPGEREIPLDLEIRNARPSPDGKRLILGTRLASIAPTHRAWYDALVARCAAV